MSCPEPNKPALWATTAFRPWSAPRGSLGVNSTPSVEGPGQTLTTLKATGSDKAQRAFDAGTKSTLRAKTFFNVEDTIGAENTISLQIRGLRGADYPASSGGARRTAVETVYTFPNREGNS